MSVPDDFAGSLKLTELVLSWVGLKIVYPPKKKGFIHWIQSEWFYVICFIQLLLTVIGEFIYLYTALGRSFLEVTALAPCIGFCILGMTKMHTISSSRRVIQTLVEEIKGLWPNDENASEKIVKIKADSLKTVKQTTSFFFWLYTVLICLFNSDPILMMALDWWTTGEFKLLLPYFVWYPFNAVSPLIVYFAVFLYQVGSGFIAAIGIVGPDCLFQVSCSHICMLLNILYEELLHVIPDISVEEAEKMDNENLIDKVKQIVKKHQKLITLSHDLADIYSFVIMVNIVGGSFIICLVGFQATSSDMKQLVKFSIFLWSSLVQVLILSWYGNNLIETSSSLADAAYNSRWYLTSLKYRKMLLIIIVRSQKPLYVTAMKFSIVSLKSFTSILSTSWSYFTLLKTVYEPK